MRKANMQDTTWHWFDYDPITFKTLYMRFTEDGKVQVQERIPEWLATQIIEENKEKAKLFDSNGGWSGAKLGAVVANVPDFIDKHWKTACGWNPSVSGWYDRDKYNSFLDDSDYAHFRTGGGKVGRRRLTDAPLLPKAVKETLAPVVVP